jgi:hypothetical protein
VTSCPFSNVYERVEAAPASGRPMSVPAAAIETPREAEVELAAEPSTRFRIVIPQGGQMLDIGETSYAA